MLDEKLCQEKHRRIDDELSRQNSWIGDHERKIDCLQRSDASNTTQIANLTKAIGSQTKAIWGLVTSVGLLLLGFFIWYVQQI
ncbi:MAG: hypothetical protein PHO15_00460 [Eubacteriales bacterium]|nr:hypothetical protein [Eubacteriales bacterium]